MVRTCVSVSGDRHFILLNDHDRLESAHISLPLELTDQIIDFLYRLAPLSVVPGPQGLDGISSPVFDSDWD